LILADRGLSFQAMKIYLPDYEVDQITDVREQYNPKELDLEFVDLKYQKDLEMDGTVEKGKETLTFQGHLVSEVEFTCGRCLKTVTNPLDQPFQLYYDIRGLEQVDATNDLREVLILNHPLSFVCSEGCRGLCPQCGVNRNEQQCQCKAAEDNSSENTPFKSMLKKFKEEKKNGTS